MNKNIIIRSLLNGILTFILVTLVLSVKGMTFAQAIVAPYTIFLTITAIAGSFIGFEIKALRQ